MLQFNVPQFIDVEDRIIGVLTIKQFAFIAAGGLLDVALFKLFYPNFAFWVGVLPITGVAAFLAFFKFNGRPIYSSLSLLTSYVTNDKLYVFKQDTQHLDASLLKQAVPEAAAAHVDTREERGSQLKQIAALLDSKSTEESDTLRGSSIEYKE